MLEAKVKKGEHKCAVAEPGPNPRKLEVRPRPANTTSARWPALLVLCPSPPPAPQTSVAFSEPPHLASRHGPMPLPPPASLPHSPPPLPFSWCCSRSTCGSRRETRRRPRKSTRAGSSWPSHRAPMSTSHWCSASGPGRSLSFCRSPPPPASSATCCWWRWWPSRGQAGLRPHSRATRCPS
eukprot:scaffold6950_cov79-Isochrysis_galbana.AAC.2